MANILKMSYLPLGYDSPSVALAKIRANFSDIGDYIDNALEHLYNTTCKMAGGVVWGMELSANGLSIDISPGVVIIDDVIIETEAFSVGARRNTSGFVFLAFGSDGYKYHIGSADEIPPGYSYIILGSYSATGSSVSVSNSSRDDAIPIANRYASGSFTLYVAAHQTVIYTVEHDEEFVIPGYITVSLSGTYSSDFYAGVYGQENVTPTSFEVEVANTGDVGANIEVSWTRTGMMKSNPLG